MKINAIGLWTMRLVLVIGAIVSGCLGKEEVAGWCIFALVLSFLLLNADDDD